MDEALHDIRQALGGIQLFSDVLSPAQLDRLAERCRPALFPAGSILIEQGEFGNSMFCIVEGDVSVGLAGPAKRRHEFRTLHAGTVVGEMELLSGTRRTATVTALTDVSALEIPKSAVDKLLRDSPELAQNFQAVFAIRQEMLHQITGGAKPASPGWLADRVRRFVTRLLREPERRR